MRAAWKREIGVMGLAALMALWAPATLPAGQAPQQAPPLHEGTIDPILTGALDVHVHIAPDSAEPQPRGADIIDITRLAKERGMRALVLKQHFDETAPMAYIARKIVPGIEVFGGIVLNQLVGGISTQAVEHMANVKGGWGRMVWMPTCGFGSMTKYCPPVPILNNGELLPEVKAVIGVIAKRRTVDSNGELVLATAHLPPDQALPVLREAKAQGVKHMIVTHPVGNWTSPQIKEAISLGAFIEITVASYIRELNAGRPDPGKALADAIKAFGVDNIIITSDLGQLELPTHPDGLALGAQWLRTKGFTDKDLNRMLKENPARLMGLPAS